MGESPVPVWIGTAGYAWPDWVGPFYPVGTSAERMPRYYATQFPCVEINSTFHRPPTPGQMTRLAQRTAPGFRFSLKVPRTVSHEHSIHDLRPLHAAADELARGHRLIGFVLQFPETFHDTPHQREWVRRVGDGLRPYPAWVEFRHRSWHRPHLGDWLRERGLELAAIDVPDLPALFPPMTIDSGSNTVYARLHTRTVDNWHGSARLRYDFDYTDDALRQWIGLLTAAAPRLTDVHLIFNNCRGIQGVRNARRMAELLRAEAPAFRVVDPPAPPPPTQGTLFDGE